MIKNCFSIDVEDFIEANQQSFSIPEKYSNNGKAGYELEKNMDVILSLLGKHNIKATFFFLGRIAHDSPSIVKQTAEHGHEIACHGYNHLRVFDMDKREFRENLLAAKQKLEDVSGQRVCGFRAPDFSITKSSLWALDILSEVGFLYDSSIYPTGLHDVYGVENAVDYIHTLPNGLTEFPLSIVTVFNKAVPYGGGGYFRLYPLSITKFLVAKANRNKRPCMFKTSRGTKTR